MPHVTTNNPTISLGFTSSTTAASPWTYGKITTTNSNSLGSVPTGLGSTGMSSSPAGTPGLSGMVGSSAFGGGASVASSSAAGAGVSKDVLRNLQDVVWSDDEEDPECPLCMEELDPSDVNFKPCVCGYQICRFCHHQIIHDLNGLCPACRRRYEDQEIQFQPVDPEEMKRLQQAKALKQKANKQLEALGRRHLRDVRIVRKDMVYVTGMRMTSGDKEEFLSLLRSNDYFGQYGKISKIFLRKGSSTSDPSANSLNSVASGDDSDLGIYITYIRREDAARAISALDGYPAPSNPGRTLKASYGSTKYCLSWLRGVKCEDGSACMGMHEWAGEGDTFTRGDMTTMQHTIKDTGTTMDLQLQSRERTVSSSGGPKASTVQPISKQAKTPDEGIDSSALPRTAHWATRPPAPPVQPPIKRKAKVLSLSSLSKPTLTTLPAPSATSAGSTGSATASPVVKVKTPFATPSASVLAASRSAKAAVAATPAGSSSAASSTLTPAASSSPAEVRSRNVSEAGRSSMTVLSRSTSTTTTTTKAVSSATPSVVTDSPVSTSNKQTLPEESEPERSASPDQIGSNGTATPVPVSTTTADNGDKVEDEQVKHAPMETESTPVQGGRADSASPATSPSPASPPMREANPAYQPSVQAQAVVDEVLSRREGQAPVYQIQSPYPDFDDFMECFADGDFTYRLDVKLEVEEGKLENLLAGVEDILAMGKAEAAIAGPSSYDGVFDPFLDPPLDDFGGIPMTRTLSNGAEDESKKKGSRFGFANRSGPPETAMSTLSSLMAPSSSRIMPDVRAFAQLDMASAAAAGRPQENLSNPNYFAGLPGTSASRVDNEMTPSSKSAMPYPMQTSSPAGTHQERAPSAGGSMPPPPPGLGGPVNTSTFPAYQQQQQQQQQQGVNANRNMQQAMEQQMMASMHGYQHQFQADGRRTASPGLQQALRGGSGTARFPREGYNANETFPFQDPAILRMAPHNFPAAQNRFMNEPQAHLYDMNAGISPYQQHQQQQQPQPQQPQQQQQQQQQQQNFQDNITPNARLLQAMHEQMGGARSASPGLSANRTASRQAYAKMY